MSRWLSVTQLQEPFDSGPDASGYPTRTVNCLVRKEPSDTFELEVVALLVADGVGTYGVDIFTGSAFDVPSDRPSLQVSASGGLSPLLTHSTRYGQPTVQLMARAPGDDMAAAALVARALDAIISVQDQQVDPDGSGDAVLPPWIDGGWIDA